MAQATVDNRTARRSPLEIIVDRIWRFFCSVRAAVFEIAILAFLVLLGTLRGSDAPQWLANAVPPLQGLVDRWYDWDVFHSLPFMAILAVLCVAITVCTINRVPGIWKTIANPQVRTTRGFLTGSELSATLALPYPAEETTGRVQRQLASGRYRVLSESHSGDVHVYADKNRWAKLATFPFHLALILILIGGIVGARYGFREQVFVVPEGFTREVGHGTGLSVKLERFSDSWREDGTPAKFSSDLILYKNGNEVDRDTITVNNPMSHGTVTFYQASYGQAATIRVTDQDGRVLFEDSIPLGLYVSTLNPDSPAGVQNLPQIGAQLHVIAPDNDRANLPELDNLQLSAGQMFFQLRSTTGNPDVDNASGVIYQGETLRLGDINVEFIREGRYTLMQVASNPGMPIFWIASFLLVAGLALTFYFPHRRIRGLIAQAPGATGSTVLLAPLARWDWSGQRDFRRTIERLEREFGVRATVTERNREQVAASDLQAEGNA